MGNGRFAEVDGDFVFGEEFRGFGLSRRGRNFL